jgi:hypothetical protein
MGIGQLTFEMMMMLTMTLNSAHALTCKTFLEAFKAQYRRCCDNWEQYKQIQRVGNCPWFWRWAMAQTEDKYLLSLWGAGLESEFESLGYVETLKNIRPILIKVLGKTAHDWAKIDSNKPCLFTKAVISGNLTTEPDNEQSITDILCQKEYGSLRESQNIHEVYDQHRGMLLAWHYGYLYFVKVCLNYECQWSPFLNDNYESPPGESKNTHMSMNYLRHPLRWATFMRLMTRIDLCTNCPYLSLKLWEIEQYRTDFDWPKEVLRALETFLAKAPQKYTNLQDFIESAKKTRKPVQQS